MRRKFTLISVLALLLTFIAFPAWAAPYTSSSNATLDDVGIRSFNMLMDGTSEITADTASIAVRCTTSAYYPVDEIGLVINIQRWDGNSWSTIKTISYADYYSDYILKGFNYAVEPGYSYRLYTKHYCSDGMSYESAYSTTNGVYVN